MAEIEQKKETSATVRFAKDFVAGTGTLQLAINTLWSLLYHIIRYFPFLSPRVRSFLSGHKRKLSSDISCCTNASLFSLKFLAVV